MSRKVLFQVFVWSFLSLFFVSCSKFKPVKNYGNALAVEDIVIAVPRGTDEKPVWRQAILTPVSMGRCQMSKTLPLPGGNRWYSKNRFFCLEGLNRDNTTFREIRRDDKNWQFRWVCEEGEEGCVMD